jgi:hypothetical protein
LRSTEGPSLIRTDATRPHEFGEPAADLLDQLSLGQEGEERRRQSGDAAPCSCDLPGNGRDRVGIAAEPNHSSSVSPNDAWIMCQAAASARGTVSTT